MDVGFETPNTSVTDDYLDIPMEEEEDEVPRPRLPSNRSLLNRQLR